MNILAGHLLGDILFQNKWLARVKMKHWWGIGFQDEGGGQIADQTEDSIYIVSEFFTGWMLKSEYFELLGFEE